MLLPSASLRLLMNHSMLKGGMVKVCIGANKRKEYDVHEDLICSFPLFERKFSDYLFGNGGGKALHLVDETADDVEVFINWLYRRTLSPIDQADEDIARVQAIKYVTLYLRAKVWNIHALQNDIMDCLRARKTCKAG